MTETTGSGDDKAWQEAVAFSLLVEAGLREEDEAGCE